MFYFLVSDELCISSLHSLHFLFVILVDNQKLGIVYIDENERHGLMTEPIIAIRCAVLMKTIRSNWPLKDQSLHNADVIGISNASRYNK